MSWLWHGDSPRQLTAELLLGSAMLLLFCRATLFGHSFDITVALARHHDAVSVS